TTANSTNNVSFNHAILEYGGGANIGIVDINGGNPQFDNCIFRYSANYGIHHTANTTSALAQNCSFQNNSGYPLYWNASQVHRLGSGNSFAGNNPNRILLRAVQINNSETWINQGVPLEAESGIIVRANGNEPLVMSPGIQLLFRPEHLMEIGYTSSDVFSASLYADGVTFGAVNPALGWKGIDFQYYTEPSTLTNCTIRDVNSAAQAGIWIRGISHLTLQNCLFDNIDTYALRCVSSSPFSLSGSTISNCVHTVQIYARDLASLGAGNQYLNNTDNRIHCLGGAINSSSTWTTQPIPILVTVNITGFGVQAPITVIPEGTVVEFAAGVSYSVGHVISGYGGILQATGVTFRGSETTPGHWVGLILNRYGGPHTLSGCTISDAGYGSSPGLHIACPGSTISDCNISNCAVTGISVTGSAATPVLQRNFISNNQIGIICSTGANPLIGGSAADANSITGNSLYGVQNTFASTILNAEWNWWGAATGPYHPSLNPGGGGNAVSDYVDFNPWLPQDIELPAPDTVSIQVVESDILLNWEEVPGAATYTVYYSSSADSGFSLLQDGIQTGQYLHAGGASGPRGFYFVTAQETQ
ncbi:MAG TPA: right-handed parallel beta-helix repeat-containing protein, partial [Candidatus Syntrophosphaera sp.]|nr:right-handed parallel beta-helix repeat-containing protein [Candidatus Syntrophosphaera sp.]